MKEKILFIAQEGLNKGGVQTVIMNITKELSSKYQFDIILFTNESRYYDEIFKSLGGRIFRISFFNSRNIYVKRLEKFLRKTIGYFLIKKIILRNGPYKAIHCHNSIESSTALSAAKSCGISKRINQIHVVFDDSNSCFFSRMHHEYLKEKMSRLATSSIGCSDLACKSLIPSTLPDVKEFCVKKDKPPGISMAPVFCCAFVSILATKENGAGS